MAGCRVNFPFTFRRSVRKSNRTPFFRDHGRPLICPFTCDRFSYLRELLYRYVVQNVDQRHEIRENWLGDSHIVFRGISKFWHVISVPLDRSGVVRCQRPIFYIYFSRLHKI